MKIKYKFATGEVTEVEVSEEIGAVIIDSRCKEHADNERHRDHTAFSMDAAEYEDKDYFSSGDDPESRYIAAEIAEELQAALAQLTEVQRGRFQRYADGETIAEIARSEGAAFNSVKESIEAARRKLKKIL